MSRKRKSSMGNVLEDETESEIPSSSRRFPVDSENPFESPFIGSDVVLIVEGKKLYVDKKTLSLHSPVFQAMFDGDFAEKDAEEIPIKDTKYIAIVRFLRQMYPVKSFQIDDEILEDLLLLADFYNVKFIREKCENYIEEQLKQPDGITYDRNMFLLLMCERSNLRCLSALLDRTSKLCIRTEHELYESLKLDTKMDLLKRRCTFLEEENARKNEMMTKVKLSFERLCPRRGSCAMCNAKFDFGIGVCKGCITQTLHRHLPRV